MTLLTLFTTGLVIIIIGKSTYLRRYTQLIKVKELQVDRICYDDNKKLRSAYQKARKKKLSSWKPISHKSFFKGKSLFTQSQLLHLIEEDLSFTKDDKQPLHASLRFYERLSTFYADRELHQGLVIPSPDGQGLLEVVHTFTYPIGLCACLYKRLNSQEYYLVLRGTAIHPHQSQYLSALREDCYPCIGMSSRQLPLEALHLPPGISCTLIGMSLGGAQAMILYARFPQYFKRLVTVNAPYVELEDQQRLEKNCQKNHVYPLITCIQTYEDHVQDLGCVHLGWGMSFKEAKVELYLLKRDQKQGREWGKRVSGLFEKRLEKLKKSHEHFSFFKTLGYTLNLLRQLRDKHQENLTRGLYIYDYKDNSGEAIDLFLNNQKDFRQRFDKLRKRLLHPLVKGFNYCLSNQRL